VENYNLKFKTGLDQRAYKLALRTIIVLEKIDFRQRSAEVIAKQLIRSITSIAANMIEARSGSSRRDFVNFYQHSLKSANESKFWIAMLLDSKIVELPGLAELLDETEQMSNMLAASIIKLKGKDKF
jgi:four helix bundle protein